MSSNHQSVQRLSDLTADIDLMKIPEKDTHTVRALCIFKKKPKKFGTPPHTVLIIEGLNEDGQHYFYEVDFVPIYESITGSAFLPSDLLQNVSGFGRYIPWYLTPGKVRVRGYNIDFSFFNIAEPSNIEPYGYLPIREPNTLKELLRTKILLQRAAMLICVINKQTEAALLEDIKADFFRNVTTNPLIYNFAGITVTQSSSSEINSAITVQQAIQRFQNHILEVADYHHRREHSVANSTENKVYSHYAQLLSLLSEEQKSQLQAMIKEERLQPQSLQFSGAGHNCMTWTEEKVKKQGIEISWDFSLPIKVLSRIIHHPGKISIPDDISREKKDMWLKKSRYTHHWCRNHR